MKKRYVAVGAAVVIAWGLKRHYADARPDDLRWMLSPTAWLAGLVSGATFDYQPGEGYLSREHLFLIEKSCAGVNFMIAALGLIGFGLSRHARGGRRAVSIVAGSLALGYLAAVFVNAARILLALRLASADLASGWWTAARIHRLEGIAVYFAGLLLLDLVARAFAPAPPASEAR